MTSEVSPIARPMSMCFGVVLLAGCNSRPASPLCHGEDGSDQDQQELRRFLDAVA